MKSTGWLNTSRDKIGPFMSEISTQTLIKVPFYDVDAMEVAWHGHYVKYMEKARCELLDLIGYNYPQMKASGYFWPVIELKIKYIKPLRFGQQVLVKSTLAEIEYGLRVNFEFIDVETEARLTKAHTKQVAVDVNTGEMCLLSPDVLAEKVEHHLGAQ